MSIIFFKIKYIILLIIVYLISACIVIILETNFVHTYNTAHAKKLCYQHDIDQYIKQLQNTSNAHSQCLVQLQQQLLENQQDTDMLRGYIQDIQHHITQIQKNQEESYKQFNNILNKYNTICPSGENISQLSVPINVINSKIHQSEDKSVNNEDIAYKHAVKLVLEKKQYKQAIQEFQNFIKNYPKSDYQPNAHYWIGQLYYNKGNKNDASYHFAIVVKNYPKSLKAPDALLKIGIIMQEMNQIDKAKTVYKQIGKLYPNSNASKNAQKYLLRL